MLFVDLTKNNSYGPNYNGRVRSKTIPSGKKDGEIEFGFNGGIVFCSKKRRTKKIWFRGEKWRDMRGVGVKTFLNLFWLKIFLLDYIWDATYHCFIGLSSTSLLDNFTHYLFACLGILCSIDTYLTNSKCSISRTQTLSWGVWKLQANLRVCLCLQPIMFNFYFKYFANKMQLLNVINHESEVMSLFANFVIHSFSKKKKELSQKNFIIQNKYANDLALYKKGWSSKWIYN